MLRLKQSTVTAALLFLGIWHTSSYANHKPPRSQLQQALQRVGTMQAMVGDLIVKGQSDGDGDGDGDGNGDGNGDHRRNCQDIRSPRECKLARCEWVERSPRFLAYIPPRDHARGVCRDVEVIENDRIALSALRGMNKALERLALKMEAALDDYHQPEFWDHQRDVCHKARQLQSANRGAKVSAELPRRGNLRPHDFEPIAEELSGVQMDFDC